MLLSAQHLALRRGRQIILRDASLELHPREVVALIGGNGAGKTTLLEILTGALTPDAGSVHYQAGLPAFWLGYLPDKAPLYPQWRVCEFLQMCAQMRGMRDSKAALTDVVQRCGLQAVAHKRCCELSHGYRQRVGLAQALIHKPSFLVLDEPTNGLDPQQILEIRQIIRELGKEKIILLSSHIMQEIQAVCQRVLILHKGKIILDKQMKHLQDKEQTVEILFDYRVEEQLLRRIPHIKTIRNNEEFFFTLTFDTQEDMRGKLFDFAMENGLKILQMNHKHTDLEQLFMELTQNN